MTMSENGENDEKIHGTANRGVFSLEVRDSNTPYIKEVRVVTSVTCFLDD